MNNKRFKRGVIILLLVILVNVELPYNDKSLIEYVFPTVSIFNTEKLITSTTHIGGIVSLLFSIWACIEIAKSKKLKLSGFSVAVVILYIILPLGMGLSDYLNTPIYFFGNNLKSIHVVESTLDFNDYDEQLKVRWILEMEIFDDDLLPTYVILKLSDEADRYFEQSSFVIMDDLTKLPQDRFTTGKVIELSIKEGVTLDQIDLKKLERLDYELIFRNKDNELVLKRNDLY